tara:strand:+ start:287 stop:439 length:153 start_codon:yes stop_codon:yes gene_type:complete
MVKKYIEYYTPRNFGRWKAMTELLASEKISNREERPRKSKVHEYPGKRNR